MNPYQSPETPATQTTESSVGIDGHTSSVFTAIAFWITAIHTGFALFIACALFEAGAREWENLQGLPMQTRIAMLAKHNPLPRLGVAAIIGPLACVGLFRARYGRSSAPYLVAYACLCLAAFLFFLACDIYLWQLGAVVLKDGRGYNFSFRHVLPNAAAQLVVSLPLLFVILQLFWNRKQQNRAEGPEGVSPDRKVGVFSEE